MDECRFLFVVRLELYIMSYDNFYEKKDLKLYVIKLKEEQDIYKSVDISSLLC